MKNLLYCSIAVCCAIFSAQAASEVKIMPEKKPFYADVSVSAYGGVEHPNFSKPEWGAGLELSKALNKNVQLSVDIFSFETDNWRDQAVDRVSVLGQYELFQSANKSVGIYGLGGGGYNFRDENFLLTVGLGIGVNVTKHFSLFADSRTYSEFNGNPGQSSRAGISLSF